MSRWFRLREDGALIVLCGLLLATAIVAALSGSWLHALLALALLAPAVLIWYRQMRSRWCPECNEPMVMKRIRSGEIVRQQYRCEVCGRNNRSGVELEWPD